MDTILLLDNKIIIRFQFLKLSNCNQLANVYDMDSVINTGICCDTNDQGFCRRHFATGTWQ